MDLASVVAALASVGVRVSGSTPNNNIQGDSSRACPTGLAGPEPSGTHNDPGQHFQGHQGALRQDGTEGPQVRAGTHKDRAPQETPRGGSQPPKNQEGAGAGTEARRKRAPQQTPRPTPRKGIPRRGDQRRPTPTERRKTPGGAPPNMHR